MTQATASGMPGNPRVEQQEFIETILENSSDGIIACNANGVLTLFNHAARMLHGMADLPVASTEWAETYSLYEEDGKTTLTPDRVPLMRALTEGHVEMQIFVIPAGRVSRRKVLCLGRAIYKRDGTKIGAIIMVKDVTDKVNGYQLK